jgi:predicted component of type VI protein secretion system
MAQGRSLAEPDLVTIHLLDAAQGHPVQTWRFHDKTSIVVGRSEDSDIVIADAHVSRVHAKLIWQDGTWTLASVGRHGTLVADRLVAETQLGSPTTFRLGASGPTLRFERGATERRTTETIDSIQPDLMAMLAIDRDRQLQEADEIAGNALFQELQERVRQTKLNTTEDTQVK